MSNSLKKEFRRIMVAVFLLIVVTFVVKTREISLSFQAVFYMVPYLIIGFEVLKKALIKIRQGKVFSEYFLMSLATLGAFALSFMTGKAEFAEAVFVMIFYQVGELFEHIAEGSSKKSISALLDLRPDIVHLEREGQIVDIDPKEVEKNQILLIRPGEKIALDGIVIEGKSQIDTATLTGESLPRKADIGDQVLSGTVNMTGVI